MQSTCSAGLGLYPDRVNERVLIVDDEPSAHESRAYLERQGFVLSATNGREGLRLAKDRRPALIVLDLMLPDL